MTQPTPTETAPNAGQAPATPPAPQAPAQQELTVEQLREQLTKVNAEAAGWRVKFREAESKLAQAKSPEEVAAAVAELKATNDKLAADVQAKELELLRARVGKDLPPELQAVLQGTTEAELKAHAEQLAKFVTPPEGSPEILGGGLNGGQGGNANDFDPAEYARKARAGQL